MDFLKILAQGIGQTLLITATAFAIGAVLGLPLALLRRSQNLIIRAPAAFVIETVRAVPPIVVLFLIYFGLGSGALQMSTFQAASIGLGLISMAYLAEIYRAGINSVHNGQWEATRALALPRRQTYTRVILPQSLIVVIPPAATFAIGLLKDSAVASIIGAQDITFRAFQETQATLQGLTIFGIAGILYILLSIPIAIVSRWTDHALRSKVVT